MERGEKKKENEVRAHIKPQTANTEFSRCNFLFFSVHRLADLAASLFPRVSDLKLLVFSLFSCYFQPKSPP